MNLSRFFSASLPTGLATLALLAGNVRVAHADESAPPPVATVEVRSPAPGVVMVLAAGITMTALSSTAIERDADPQGASRLRARVTGLSLGGTF